jgi:hypothetical protein
VSQLTSQALPTLSLMDYLRRRSLAAVTISRNTWMTMRQDGPRRTTDRHKWGVYEAVVKGIFLNLVAEHPLYVMKSPFFMNHRQ